MRALAGLLFCDASNVTGIVDRLDARGLIERRPAPQDHREIAALPPTQQPGAARRPTGCPRADPERRPA